ncbi:GntR family transcriptional regulator [bacterium LRH843]|nr:GntR family transcriptional regulator [bacterium LRH843]
MATLKELAYQKIKKLILIGELKPGDFLTEREFVDRFEMSRTPIRSAFDRLEAEGLINNFPNKGPIVAEISVRKAIDIYDVRIALESHVVMSLSSIALTNEQLDWFKGNLSMQKECIDSKNFEEFSSLDTNFHHELVKIYQNTEIIRIFEQIQDRLQLLALKVFKTNMSDLIVYYNDHVEIFNFILNNQATQAADRMVRHLENGKKIITS